jgi:hypothetical protein
MHDFFTASASVAGALIGLLFVAISVSADRLAREEMGAPVHRIRASAALTAFLNALSVSLFALVDGDNVGFVSVSVSGLGLVFVIASLLALYRQHQMHWTTGRDALFLVGLLAVFVTQLCDGIAIISRPRNNGDVETIADMVIVCFLIGIARSWELIGGPSIGLRKEVKLLVRDRRHGDQTPDDEPADYGGRGADHGEPPHR